MKGMNTQETSHYPIPSSITIDSNTANQRLDRFLRKYFRKYPDISLVMIFKAIRTGQIKVSSAPSVPLLNRMGDVHKTPSNEEITIGGAVPSRNGGIGGSKKVDQSYKLQV